MGQLGLTNPVVCALKGCPQMTPSRTVPTQFSNITLDTGSPPFVGYDSFSLT